MDEQNQIVVFLQRIDQPRGKKEDSVFKGRLLRPVFFAELPQRCLDENRALVQDDLIEQIVFIVEIEIKRALGDPGLFDNLVNGGGMHALVDKEMIGCINHADTLCIFFLLQCLFLKFLVFQSSFATPPDNTYDMPGGSADTKERTRRRNCAFLLCRIQKRESNSSKAGIPAWEFQKMTISHFCVPEVKITPK